MLFKKFSADEISSQVGRRREPAHIRPPGMCWQCSHSRGHLLPPSAAEPSEVFRAAQYQR